MIFKTADKILSGEKTQTRRICKPHPDGTTVEGCEMLIYPNGIATVAAGRNGKWHTKWQVGRTYAVCPGRGKHSIGRVKITNIRREWLWNITDEDCQAEGIADSYEGYAYFAFHRLWNSINKKPGTRWEDNPEVWVLEFCLMDGGSREPD